MSFPACLQSLLGITALKERITRLEDTIRAERAHAWTQSDATGSRLARMYECKVCFDSPIQSVLLPCGHAMMCSSCSKTCSSCPVCQLEVERVTDIYLQ